MSGRDVPYLAPLAALYGLGVRARNALYDAGWLAVHVSDLPVISIGNLVVGGTGKTPATIWLAGELVAAGRHPAILTRGYGRRARGAILLAPGRPARSPRLAGDEPLEMWSAHPDVPVLVAADRVLGARLVRRACRPDLLLLDDGFQHRRLARDVDLVLLDARAPFGNGRLLPAGPLREPAAGLSRADAVLLTRAERVSAAGLAAAERAVRERLGEEAWLGVAEHRIEGLVAFDPGSTRSPEPGQAVLATAGIADPAGFAAALEAAGWPVAEIVAFPDHARLGPADHARVTARRAGPADRDDAQGCDPLAGWLPGGGLGGVVGRPVELRAARSRRTHGGDRGAPGAASAETANAPGLRRDPGAPVDNLEVVP